MKYRQLAGMALAMLAALLAPANELTANELTASANAMEQVIITATLRPTATATVTTSATVLPAATLQSAGEQHLAEVLSLVPNLSAAGATSRPRFFHLRGVGEREQYQGAPNPSVAFLIDDMDYSGIGMPALLFDVEQVEVLRGPQGLSQGANALAGLISVRTVAAGGNAFAKTEWQQADYNSWGLAGAAGGSAAGGRGAWRVSAQQYRSDGFMRNTTLARDDTHNLDERLVRGKWHWQEADRAQLDLTVHGSVLDNGYDAWTIDNSRVSLADKPGRDAQRTRGASVRWRYRLANGGEVTTVSSSVRAHTDYSFDGDWGSDASWGSNGPYDFFEQITRTRHNASQDVRYASRDQRWLAGFYALALRERQHQEDRYRDSFGPFATEFDSQFRATNLAAYGQYEWQLGPRASSSLGLRTEQRAADYRDSLAPDRLQSREVLWGGALSWRWQRTQAEGYYAVLSRGYKAGGFNIGAAVPEWQRRFAPETLWNIETGIHLRQPRGWPVSLDAALFYMRRADQQIEVAAQYDAGNPLLYVYLKQNAAGQSRGAELSGRWQVNAAWSSGFSLGLLDARYGQYSYQGELLDGERQAYAPPYQVAVDLNWQSPAGAFVRLDWSAHGARFLGAPRAEHTGAYQLWNVHAGVRRGAWSATAWVRNALNERYALHGFYFGNEPPDFPDQLYLQQAPPRQAGLTVRYQWH